MPTSDVAQRYEPPSVEAPSHAQEAVLQALGARVQHLLAAAFASFGVTCTPDAEPDWQPRRLETGFWAAAATWSHGGDWRLLLSPKGTTALLAAQLGQDELAEHALTDLDLRLLRLPARALAADLGRELRLAAGAPSPALARGPVPAVAEAVVAWRMHVAHGPVGGEVVLTVPWSDLRRCLTLPAGEQRLRRDELADAPVVVEAVVVAPPVTPRELLEMQPGDVLALGPGEQQSILRANGAPVAWGRIGAKGATLAISIQHVEGGREA